MSYIYRFNRSCKCKFRKVFSKPFISQDKS
jgi:hypothetical protein